jgi:diacylglycerol kinase
MQNVELKSQEARPTVQSQMLPPSLRATTVWHSFGYAFAGIWYVYCTQRNAKIHVGIMSAVILMGLFLQLSAAQWAILVVTIGLVLSGEMFNTVVEALVDLTSPEFHPLAKVAKDAAAGGVLLLAITGVIVGLFVLGPNLLEQIMALIMP